VKALVGGLAALLLVALAGSAVAAPKRVGVPKFEGPQEAIIRKRVMSVLKGEGYELVKSREIEAAVQSTGASLDSNDGYRAIAKELALSAIVTGEVQKKKARIAVRDGSDGSVSAEGSFAGANPNKVAAEIGKGMWRRLGSAIERGKVPAGAKKPQAAAVAAAPEDNEDAPEAGGGGDDEGEEKKPARAEKESRKSEAEAEGEKADTKSDTGDEEERPRKKRKKKPVVDEAPPPNEEEANAGGAHLAWLDASLGFGGFNRNLVYNQDVNMTLRQYQLPAGADGALRVAFYPGALATTGVGANLGLDIALEQGFAVTSKVNPGGKFPDGATFNTIIHDFALGVRYRQPIGEHELGFSLTGGEHAFAFRTSATSDPNMARSNLDLPDTIYRYARIGVSARVALPAGVSLMAGGGYRYILNSGGQIHDQFFKHLTVAGADAYAGVGYRFTSMMEARVVGELRRYWYDMHSQAGDPLLAGGAVDQYLGVNAMLAFRLGDEPKGASHDEDEDKDMGKEKTRPHGGGDSSDTSNDGSDK